MVNDIRNQFYALLEEIDWMDDGTKLKAKEKAEMVAFITAARKRQGQSNNINQ